MSYTLRPYQQEAVDASLAYLLDASLAGRHGIVVQPTGGGKSLVIANIVKRLPGQSIVLQPSKEILEQNAAKLASYGHRPAIFSASFGRQEIGRITLATIGSVIRHAEHFRDVPYVLIDECHAGTSAKGSQVTDFLAALGDARILGLTATPFRLASNSLGSQLRFLTRTRPRIFRDVVHVTQIGDLVRSGYWAVLDYRLRTRVERSKLALNSTGADYTDASVAKHFAEIGFVRSLVDEVRLLLREGRRHILVFTRFVADSERLAAEMAPLVGVVTAETPAGARDRTVQAFRSGRLPIVANVGVLGMGFDFPELDAVVLARPSVSLAVYYQQVGRAVRPHPHKMDAAIVDMVGLTTLFGKAEELAVQPGGYKGEQWVVSSGGRPLTNTYFAQRDGVDPASGGQAQQRRSYWASRRNRAWRRAR